MHRYRVSNVARSPFGIRAEYQLREHFFERVADHQGPQMWHCVVCDNTALMQDDYPSRQLLHYLEHVRAVQNGLTTSGQYSDEMTEYECRCHIETRIGFVKDENVWIV